MSPRVRVRVVALVAGVLLAVSAYGWPVSAQSPTKRPVSYDVYDSWRSIGGTRLSDDGQWLAYALTSQGEDGELVVRNLTSNEELRHPRGTGPRFTPDSRFVVFTIVPEKSDDDEGGAPAGPIARGRFGGRGRGGGGNGPARNSVGIMELPSGTVTTVEQVRSFGMPEESSTWLAMHKGTPEDDKGEDDDENKTCDAHVLATLSGVRDFV